MRSLTTLILLCSVCALVQLGLSQKCDLSFAKQAIPFPDVEKMAIESFQMAVEYTVPKANQSDYYMEYYDILERRGRVEGHQAGKSKTYLYFTQSRECYELEGRACNFLNITETPSLMKDSMNEWLYEDPAVEDRENDERRSFGPSSMFKYALDAWNSSSRSSKMAYMGVADFKVRGLKAQYWRRCDTETSYVDYFFTIDKEDDPLGLGMKKIPLRVYFGGERKGVLSTQQFEITHFQPFISQDVSPFQLPKGRGCFRWPDNGDDPILPDFSDKNLQFSAEVIYRKIDFNGDDVQYWSYYSTLMMALDLTSQHLAYYYTPWNTTKPEKGKEPTVEFPEYAIYDMKHGYAFKTIPGKDSCEIIREKSYVPTYKLPNNDGELSLTDPTILFPNSEMQFLSEGENRGLKVNIWEMIQKDYVLDNATNLKIPKAIVSHSYLKDDEIEINKASVKNALVQVQLRLLGRYEKVIEVLTLNFFGFSTQLSDRRSIFDIQKCFKNDDDYSWVTLGFNADPAVLEKFKNEVPNIQANILNTISMTSELNPVRIPDIEVDIADEQLTVSLRILGKPPVMLDYLTPEEGKTITGSTEVDGITDKETCALKCLETEDNCWAFSICGAVCTFAATASSKVGNKGGCQLYRRYDNLTYIPSRELMIENIRSEVASHQVKLTLGEVQIEASSVEVTDPGEDDEILNRIGHQPNPRMRRVKVDAKLKPGYGAPVKNLGKLRFDECQRVCLDFSDCETVSYCLKDSECVLSSTYGDDLPKDSIEPNNMCSIVTRKYADNFNRSPGNILSITAKEVLKLDTLEKCARACLKSSNYECLSFDHCPQDTEASCKLHVVHYPNSKTREGVQVKNSNCGHYYRKYSTEFKKNPKKRMVGSKLTPLSNMTLEECSKACKEYGKGTCFGFDFCQDVTLFATSCILLDSDPAQMKSVYSDVCNNFIKIDPQYTPRPYSTGYAGGIGFLCFLVGLIVGAVVVFGIAYIKVNRR